ncbi:MAG: tyrosine-type recombinase/integrase [Candidatus Diapherotrites archaeon]
MPDYYAKSEKRAKLLLCRLLGRPFPDYVKKGSQFYYDVPDENKRAIEAFDNQIVARGLTDSCRIHYLRTLCDFAHFSKKPYSQVTAEDTMAFISHMKNEYVSKNYHKKLSKASVSHAKTAIKFFFIKFYEGKDTKRDIRGIPPMVSWIKRERGDEIRKLPKDMLSTQEVRRMIEASPNPRDKAIVAVLYESACRSGEFLEMKVGDVKFDQYGATVVVSGKTGDRRIRLVDSVPDLQVWMNSHPLRDDDTAPVWTAIGIRAKREYESRGPNSRLTYYRKPLYPRGLNHRLNQIAKWAGIQKNIYPHLFRHSRLTELAKKGFREAELKIMAGWTELSKSPATYIHLSGADVEEKILQMNGVLKEDEMRPDINLKPIKCPRCTEKNPATAKFCYKCSMVLDTKTAVELETVREQDDQAVQTMMARMIQMQKTMQDLFEEMSQLKAQNPTGGNQK